jgi:hypothetical protein
MLIEAYPITRRHVKLYRAWKSKGRLAPDAPIHYLPSGFTRVTNRCYAPQAQVNDLNPGGICAAIPHGFTMRIPEGAAMIAADCWRTWADPR